MSATFSNSFSLVVNIERKLNRSMFERYFVHKPFCVTVYSFEPDYGSIEPVFFYNKKKDAAYR